VDNLVDTVRGVDALVIKRRIAEAGLAKAYGHLTAAQAAQLARDAGVKQLILTHVSRRYPERDVLAEARVIFPETLVARDFDHYRIQKDKTAQRVIAAPAEEETDVNA
jgi:ribonuclease Z